MTIEVLYPELGGLYGDMANVRYLQACVPEAEVLYTDNQTRPRFVDQQVDLLYLSSMPEPYQVMAIERLRPYVRQLMERIEGGMAVLATGNALELFGEYILDQGQRIPCLNCFPFHAERNMDQRHNSMFLGRFEDIPVVGYKSQFSFCYGSFPAPFLTVTGGFGNNPKDITEGFRFHNLFATYLLGPFLVLNPLFTKYLLGLLGHHGPLAFEPEVLAAYEFRLRHLEEPGVNFLMGEHG